MIPEIRHIINLRRRGPATTRVYAQSELPTTTTPAERRERQLESLYLTLLEESHRLMELAYKRRRLGRAENERRWFRISLVLRKLHRRLGR